MLAEALQLGADPYDGDCVLLVKRDHMQLRAIVGDAVGLYLICRRFEGARLRNVAAFARDPHATEISTAELSPQLEGASFAVRRHAAICIASEGVTLVHLPVVEPWAAAGAYVVVWRAGR